MEFDYSGWQVAAILATYLFAASAKGVTGLGFSTMCLPFLAVTVGLKEALPLLIIPSISSNLVVMHGRDGSTRPCAGSGPCCWRPYRGLSSGSGHSR
jgi:hypothetical protein